MTSVCPHCTGICPRCGGKLRPEDLPWTVHFAVRYDEQVVPVVLRYPGLRCRRCTLFIPMGLLSRVHAASGNRSR